ncbi:MAG: hypothetical protein U1A72_13170 [Sulfuritalea sp.]|nr:hypothetical protein [Sulfuritalea sp.]
MRVVLDTNILLSALMARGTPPDPNDDYLLGLYQAAGADFLASGDKSHLLALERHEGTRIVIAEALVDLLGR